MTKKAFVGHAYISGAQPALGSYTLVWHLKKNWDEKLQAIQY